MKFYRQMTSEERVQYNASFARWYANRDQIVLCAQQTGTLDAAARSAFDLGHQLLQAWPFSTQFNSSVLAIPAVRCVPMLIRLSDQVKAQISALSASVQDPVIDPRTPRNIETSTPRPLETSTPRNSAPSNTPPLAPSSPLPIANLHIDQLLYLLSPSVAERARSLKAKLDERDIASNRAKDLAIAGASNDEIASFARAASDAQQFVTDTYALIDDELAEYVATELYMRSHRPEGEAMEHAFKACLSNLEECAKPFGSLDRLCAALAPYYKKTNENGCIDRRVEQSFATYKTPIASTEPAPVPDGSPSGSSAPAYDLTEYKRIWTYVNRKDVAHTDKRLKKMRQEIDTAKSAGMPNIDAMEAIYAHEAELVLAEQQKALNDGEPTLL